MQLKAIKWDKNAAGYAAACLVHLCMAVERPNKHVEKPPREMAASWQKVHWPSTISSMTLVLISISTKPLFT